MEKSRISWSWILKGRRNSLGRVENIYEGVLLVLDIDGSLLLRIISEVVN